MKKVIFTLAEARSGTLYLRNLFRLNARDCDCRHETFFDIGNPTMFGPAIYDAYAGRFGNIRARLEKKRRYIQKLSGSTYIESSHAFLKSSQVAALDFFPDLQLVHLIRDPLKVAASEAYRELWRRRLHAPFHFYRGNDGQRHFAWALTGNETIFQHFASQPLTLFQWYLIQWVEIENRAMNFLNAHGLHDRCFTLRSPHDLNDAAKVREMFDLLGVETNRPEIVFGGRKNKSIGYFMAPASTDRESQFVLERLPKSYLQIFRRRPYSDLPWASLFNSQSNGSVNRASEPENCSLPRRLSQLTC
ncbi:MAG TPA: hypothetical protein VGJ73_13225 [Verrucomicrobiae bacterium]|jgi:hypothetical protein